MEDEEDLQVVCPICGLAFPKSTMEYCSSCGREVCEDDYNDNLDMCSECATDQDQTYMDEDDDE